MDPQRGQGIQTELREGLTHCFGLFMEFVDKKKKLAPAFEISSLFQKKTKIVRPKLVLHATTDVC